MSNGIQHDENANSVCDKTDFDDKNVYMDSPAEDAESGSTMVACVVPEEWQYDPWELIGCPFPEYEEEIANIEKSFRSRRKSRGSSQSLLHGLRLIRRQAIIEIPRPAQTMAPVYNGSDSSISSSSSDDREGARGDGSLYGKARSYMDKIAGFLLRLSMVLLITFVVTSLILAVGTALISYSDDVYLYIVYALDSGNPKIMALAFIGSSLYALFLLLTFLAIVLLVPALWVSVLDIVGISFNVPFLDSFFLP